MKKSLQLLFLVLGMLLLTGCATVHDQIVINPEGKVLRDIEIKMDLTEENKLSTSLAHEEIYKRAEAEGSKVTYKDTEDGKAIYNLRKELDSVDLNIITIPYHQPQEVDSQNMVKPELLTITKDQGLFKSSYKAKSLFKIPELAEYEDLDYTLSIHLPTQVSGKTNAIGTPADNVMVWKPNKENQIDVQFDVGSINILYIVYSIALALFVVLLITYLIIRKKERNKQTRIHRRIPTRQYSHQRHSR